MYRVILCGIICLVIVLSSHSKAFALINQEISVRLDPVQHKLYTKVTLSLGEGESAWPAQFLLAEHAQIESVSSDGTLLPFRFYQGRLRTNFPEPSSKVEIHYSILYDDPVPQDFVGIEDPSYGVNATILPRGVFLAEAASWHPRAEGINSLFTVTIVGPQEMTGVTTGRLEKYTQTATETSVTWQTYFPQSTLPLAAGRYELHRDDLDDVQLLVFVSPANGQLATAYLDSIREYLSLYQDLFGPYPYEKFAVVENFYPTGYGLPGWTLLGNTVIKLPFIRSTSLPHEIAHAWWGNAVEIDYGSGNWGEGLATYVADYYLKELHDPHEAFEYRQKLLRDYASLVSAADDLPLSAFRGRMSKRDQAVGYGKGAMVFHMLRDLIGEEAFWGALKNAAKAGRGQRYGWSHLRRHFEEAADVELAGFFQQWVTRSGAPQLSLSDVNVAKIASGWQVSGSLRQDGAGYDLAVPLRLLTEKRSYEQVVGLFENQDCFLFTVSSPPRSLVVDPDSRLFRRLYPEEIPATVNDLRASRAQLVVVSQGFESLRDASRGLLRGLQWHQAKIINEAELTEDASRGRDVLFLGWPKNKHLQPQFPDEIGSYTEEISAARELTAGSPGVLFMVNKSDSGDHNIAYFLPGSVRAAEDVARRIPHYGRYSFLSFKDGQNLNKLTWQPADTPLKVLFKTDGAL